MYDSRCTLPPDYWGRGSTLGTANFSNVPLPPPGNPGTNGKGEGKNKQWKSLGAKFENNPRTGNFGALVRIFLSRTKELKISTECQDQLFIWQAHNALFMIRCLLKVFISQMSEEELHLQFSYQERAPGTCAAGEEDLFEEVMWNLVHLIIEVPLLFCLVIVPDE
ncbi:UNVERIFIED_CONTAM: hypothetical protein FKN15_077697 [Acipenser sinensis]